MPLVRDVPMLPASTTTCTTLPHTCQGVVQAKMDVGLSILGTEGLCAQVQEKSNNNRLKYK